MELIEMARPLVETIKIAPGQGVSIKDDYLSLANERGFLFVGNTPQNIYGKAEWACDKGHHWQASYANIKHNGSGCPHCSILEKQSKGERYVAQILDTLNILYSRQKGFDGCKDKKALRYDFYFSFSGHQFLVEYNGEQHYKPIERWGGAKGLKDVQRRDRIKADFSQANSLHLITIPYTDYDRIGTIIIDSLTEVTGESPLTFTGRIGTARGAVEMLDGVQLSFRLEN